MSETKNTTTKDKTARRTQKKQVVIIGGGFAGLSLVKHLRNTAVDVVVVDKNNFNQFQPLLYQVATSGLEPDSIVFPFRKQIANAKNISFRMAEVLEVNTQNKSIRTSNGNLNYDVLVLATGTTTNFFGNQSIEEHSIGLKSIRNALDIRHKMLQNLEMAALSTSEEERDALTNFVIVGGGPAGVEMAGALAEFARFILPKDYPEYDASIMKVYLIEGSSNLVSFMSQKASSNTLKYLKGLNVQVVLDEIVTDYDGTIVKTKGGMEILAKNMVWTAGVKGQIPNGINKSYFVGGGRLKTNEFMAVEGLEDVYAIGDISAIITDSTPKGHPQVAQPAMQQGKLLAKNILRMISNQEPKAFVYNDKGSMATVGMKRAVADIGNQSFAGYFAWLIWSVVHVFSIIGFRNRILVAINWLISYFSYEKSNRIIIRPFSKKTD